MATFNDFMKLDIRVGTIVKAEIFKEAKRPAYKLEIDFGDEIGIKKSSAQITEVYKPEELEGKQILAVVNFPEKQIANFLSQVLVLGTYSKQGVVLIQPTEKVENGDKLGYQIGGDFTELADKPNVKQCIELARELGKKFMDGEIDKVEMVYHHFKSAGSQILTRKTFVPIDIKSELGRDPIVNTFEASTSEARKVLRICSSIVS